MRYVLCIVCLALILVPSSVPGVPTHAAASENSSWVKAAKAEKKAKKFGRKIVKELAVPVVGVDVDDLTDTWGDARSNGRTHEGIDIIAPRSSIIVSPTKAIVIRIGKDTLGGTVVYTANPGGERFYYAHLNGVKKGLKVGHELAVGDVIGYVGNTGNASETVPHLHLGIYGKKGATNPFPRITKVLPVATQKKVLANELMKKKAELAKKND